MPFNQTGANAKADFGTYNDVAGSQTNNSKDIKTGNISAGHGGSGGSGTGLGLGAIAGGLGKGAEGGAGGSVNIS